MRTSDDASGADQAAVLVALFGQRNFEQMLAAFDDDDRGIGRSPPRANSRAIFVACCLAKEASADVSPTSSSNIDDPSR
jgi:hypothetical protein